MHYVQR